MNYKVLFYGENNSGAAELLDHYIGKSRNSTLDSNYGKFEFQTGASGGQAALTYCKWDAIVIVYSAISERNSYIDRLLKNVKDKAVITARVFICDNNSQPSLSIFQKRSGVSGYFTSSIVNERINPLEFVAQTLSGKKDLKLAKPSDPKLYRVLFYGESNVGKKSLIKQCNPENGIVTLDSNHGLLKFETVSTTTLRSLSNDWDAIIIVRSLTKGLLCSGKEDVKGLFSIACSFAKLDTKIFICGEDLSDLSFSYTQLTGLFIVSMTKQSINPFEFIAPSVTGIKALKIIKSYKVALLGAEDVGKSTYLSLINKNPNQSLKLDTNHGQFSLQIADISMGKCKPWNDLEYFKNIDGAIIMYAGDDASSYYDVSKYKSLVQGVDRNAKITVTCNRIDISEDYYKEGHGISCKKELNLQDPLLNLTKQLTGFKDLLFVKPEIKPLETKATIVEVNGMTIRTTMEVFEGVNLKI